MPQFSISKSVGKNCFGAPVSDVMAIQYALADKKQRTKFELKPYYKGKIDGKAKAATISAIECFQADKNIPVDGKVQRTGRTLNVLATGLSSRTLNDIIGVQLGEKRSGPASAVQQQAEKAGIKSANFAKNQSPLPKREADSLSSLIEAVAKRGIPLIVAQTDITDDGRFAVVLKVDRTAVSNTGVLKVYDEKAPIILREESTRSAIWTLPQPGKIRLTSRQPYDFLVGVVAPSDRFLERNGLKGQALQPVQLKIMAAIEELQRLGKLS